MCGIAGIVATDRLQPSEVARLRPMCDVLAHRGPDGRGEWHDERAALGHRRLSIVDLAAGAQPLGNEDGTVWVTYNGEIYNHADLRAPLERQGHRYRTRCDTEVIVHGYEEWGDACVERFRGMFAFAVWDSRRGRLLLARDRLGVKPLYWTLQDGRLLFGSEIKALLASGLVQPRANESALPEILSTRTLAGDETLFTGIRKLLPGHVLVYEDGRVRTRRYWDVPVREDAEAKASEPARVWVRRFRAALEESVRLRLMADVPLGMFLSGGLDSSAIAAVMARQMDRPVQTFSVAFRERAFSELQWSREVAQAIGADAHEVVIGADDFFDALPRLVWHEDEPIAHPSSVPLYFVSALARQHVKVVLTGEGSDELLAGYGRYPRSILNWRLGSVYARALPDVARAWVADRVAPRLPGRLGRYARRSFLAMPHSPGAAFFDNFAAVRLQDQQRLLASRLRGAATWHGAYAATVAHFERHPAAPLLSRLLYTDLKTYLVELLMKQDQMSMAASIESRVPFLDHRLVELVADIPNALKLSGFTTKRVLREAAKDLLPASVLNRPKMGFPVPFGLWTRGAWHDAVRDVLLDARARQRGVTDPRAVAALLEAHRTGRRDAGDVLWTLLNLELWYRTWIDGGGIQVLGGAAPAAHVTDPHEVSPLATTA
jgi:asparagine synthase (glutamine-hydrolysing)